MYAIIRIYPDRACKADDVVRTGRGFAAVLDRAHGFVSCFVLRAQDGRLVVVTLFDDQGDLHAAERLAGASVGDHLKGVGEAAEFLQGEVVFQRGL
jgi:hypothetical protein